MPRKAKAKFQLKVANPSPEGPRWFTIGKASEIEGQHGRMLIGSLTSIPLFLLQQDHFNKWNGEFILTEVKSKDEDKEG